MRMYKVTPCGYSAVIEKYLNDVIYLIKEAEIGDRLEIEIIEMDEREFASLPECMEP